MVGFSFDVEAAYFSDGLYFGYSSFNQRIKTVNPTERQIERDNQMRERYFDLMKYFPYKVDRIFEALDRIYQDQLMIASSKGI
ncbi:hypothetical protein I4U23_015041 [Adineta vaga]|nr:hypothetical protein I4U23_015041 [Adineta vaga]